MSRLRIDQVEKARADFQQEIRVKRAYYDLRQKDIGDAIGLAPARTSVLLANPDEISIGRLRAIIGLLGLDPMIVLTYVGFSPKDLKKCTSLRSLFGASAGE